MPCYLFTYHTYASWMPDRRRGYVKRNRGILPSDERMAKRYRKAMKQSQVEFDSDIQLLMLAAVLESRKKQGFELYFFSTEPTHLHLLVGWRDERPWLRLRSSLKSSVTRRLNVEIRKRSWFSEGGSRKRVKDSRHFNYLRSDYLRKHSGWKWHPEEGKFR